MKRLSMLLTIAFAISLASSVTYAYVGPGPGIGMIGSFFTLIAGVFLALFMVLLYPARLLWKKAKARKAVIKDSSE